MLFEPPKLDAAEHRVLDRVEGLKESLRWQLNEPKRWVGSLRRLSFARAIQGSNSIEGYEATLDDAAAVAVREDPLDADEETRLALAGYRDAMTYVLHMADDPDFSYSTRLVKSLHFMMTGYSLRNRPGLWRASSVYVRKEETGDIVYEGPGAELVPDLMREVAGSIAVTDDCPPLIAAGMAHLNLVMVHPFRDGNGRMARCLQSLVLARNGVLSPVFMSVEEYLGQHTQAYYDVLAEVGRGAWNPGNDARPWVRFLLKAHLLQATTLLRRVRETERTWSELDRLVTRHALPERVLPLLLDAAAGLRVRNTTYRAVLAGTEEEITEQTAGRDFKQLVDLGLLTSHGERRGRYYVAGAPLREIRSGVVSQRVTVDDSDPFA